MEQCRLGNTALTVSPVCLGADRFGAQTDRETAFTLLDRFVAAGGNFIDTANIYVRDWAAGISRSEEILGQYLRERTGCGLVIATKGAHHHPQTREKRVTRACIEADLEESLRTLGRDCIDLYWLHRDDPALPVEEIVDMMEALVSAGKIRYYGASNYTVSRLTRAGLYAKSRGVTGFSAVSNYWTPLAENADCSLWTDPTLVACTDGDLKTLAGLGLPLVPYSCTARGWVAKGAEAAGDRLNRVFDNRENRDFRERLQALAAQQGCPLQTALLRYMRDFARGVGLQLIPLTACSRMAQMEEIVRF